MRYLLFAILVTISLSSFAQQGIKGKVVWVSGNQMPGPDKPVNKAQGIKREIHIYEPTTLRQATATEGIFFNEITTRRVAIVKSRKNGKFCVKLPAGEYSVFVKEEKGLFANLFDGQNRIQCIPVKEGEYTQITIEVNYEAAY